MIFKTLFVLIRGQKEIDFRTFSRAMVIIPN